jgi:hypothetical protein
MYVLREIKGERGRTEERKEGRTSEGRKKGKGASEAPVIRRQCKIQWTVPHGSKRKKKGNEQKGIATKASKEKVD